MIDIANPAWWFTLASVVGSFVGLFAVHLETPVKTAVAAVGGVVTAAYTLGHSHRLAAEAHAAALIKVADKQLAATTQANSLASTAGGMLAALAGNGQPAPGFAVRTAGVPE